jgi:hypothetical protein
MFVFKLLMTVISVIGVVLSLESNIFIFQALNGLFDLFCLSIVSRQS